jgi:hypothetical protein
MYDICIIFKGLVAALKQWFYPAKWCRDLNKHLLVVSLLCIQSTTNLVFTDIQTVRISFLSFSPVNFHLQRKVEADIAKSLTISFCLFALT